MFALGMARISAPRTTRQSYFSGAVVDSFAPGLGAPQASLGATAQNYYDKAKASVSMFDSLVERVKRIANKAERDGIAVTYGLTAPENQDKAMYMRNALAYDLSEAEKYSPIAYEQGFPALGPSRGRVAKLESFDTAFEAAVKNAENMYGILPEPETITNYVTTTTTNPLNWVLPVLALGVGIVIAGFSGVFKK